jgi:hypothetical protein
VRVNDLWGCLTSWPFFGRRIWRWQTVKLSDAKLLAGGSQQKALQEYDADKNGTLDQQEFEEFARNLFANGPDVFFARIGKSAAVNAVVLPTAAVASKHLAGSVFGGVPLAVLAPAFGIIGKSLRGLLPV